MKNIQAQYVDLLEGRMSQSNFMRSVRRDFPQFISPTTSYSDSVKILKGKRILSETKLPEGVYGHNPNAEAPQKPGIDQLNYYQVYHGIQYELAQAPEITDEAYVKARKKVVDTILKDPDAYKDLQLANFKAVKRMDKDLEMKDVKEDNKVDKVNGMKVIKKDAPASANTSKKETKKKSKIPQMTQTPKKHREVEVMDVPGKATVLALKEHILDEMMKDNPEHEQINKGSRVKKKDLKDYDASKVGNVTDFDGHMATVKWDSGAEEHVMPNVLTKKNIPKHPEADEKFGNIPNNPALQHVKEEKVKEGIDESIEDRWDYKIGEWFFTEFPKQAEKILPRYDQDWDQYVKELGNRVFGAVAIGGGTLAAGLGMAYQAVADKVKSIKNKFKNTNRMQEVEDREIKLKNLKERLVKAIKKEGFVAKTKNTGVTIDAGRDLAKGTQAARNMEKKTGDQLTVVDTRTGVEKDV